jgi:hypothetical protein
LLSAAAVAVAGAEAGWARQVRNRPAPHEFLDAVLAYLVPSRTQAGIVRARRLLGVSIAEAAYELGNGSQADNGIPASWLHHREPLPASAATLRDEHGREHREI